LLSVKTFIPEEGLNESIIEPYHHEDQENDSSKLNTLKPHQIASMTLTHIGPITDQNPNHNILVYKQGVADTTEYSSFPSQVITIKKPWKANKIDENFKPIYD